MMHKARQMRFGLAAMFAVSATFAGAFARHHAHEGAGNAGQSHGAVNGKWMDTSLPADERADLVLKGNDAG